MPPAPEQLVEVSKYTLSSAAAGAVLQALMQYIVERRRGPLRPPQEGMKKKDALTAMAAEQRRRIEQVLRAALKGGMRVGSVSALFFSVQLGTSIYRARQDYYNATCGGMAAGGLMGISGMSFIELHFLNENVVFFSDLNGTASYVFCFASRDTVRSHTYM